MKQTQNEYPIPYIEMASYKGGRQQNNRQVNSIAVQFPLIESWYRGRLNSIEYQEIFKIVQDNSSDYKVSPLWKRRTRRGLVTGPPNHKFNYTLEQSDLVLAKLFGYSTLQAYYRLLSSRYLYAKNRGKGAGNWLLSWELLNRMYIPKDKWHKDRYTFTKIPKQYTWLFKDMLDNALFWEDGPKKHYLDYSSYDVGDERKPELYYCNLCNHSDIKDGWPWQTPAGFSSHEYISRCLNCKARGIDVFDKALGKTVSFEPYSKMQDDYFFTLVYEIADEIRILEIQKELSIKDEPFDDVF